MASALIGNTGFVGGNLLRQRAFDATYHSVNIAEIEGKRFALLFCAGAPGVKWQANREPERDLESIERLMRSLGSVSADHVVLISTVDVYPDANGVDEDTRIAEGAGTPYGQHRLLLERFVQGRFPSTVVRLPALFGPGLKKNAVYDFIHRNRLDAISPDSVFQFYPLPRLSEEIECARAAGLSLVNFATEPVSVRRVAADAFGLDFRNQNAPLPVHYDMRTKHAEAFGRQGPYLYDADEVLRHLREFLRE
ncbi:MAG: NAD-dependent epimerase/dehydratase family protein [Vicinamibacteria bacterium]